mmetsp:Transcript_21013/g.37832  ORF Transcript_21013/g.37832 Transcript_21013/m.37832 type:complete len:160 (-) Transcript_21013:13-492(-)
MNACPARPATTCPFSLVPLASAALFTAGRLKTGFPFGGSLAAAAGFAGFSGREGQIFQVELNLVLVRAFCSKFGLGKAVLVAAIDGLRSRTDGLAATATSATDCFGAIDGRLVIEALLKESACDASGRDGRDCEPSCRGALARLDLRGSRKEPRSWYFR